jgi:glycopeptide antibiotics resistance protein
VTRRAIGTLAAVVLILGMTLSLDPPWLFERLAALLDPHVSGWVIARVLNVVLFVPLGVAIGVWRRPWWLVGAAAGSVAIELTQHLLPNRSPDPWDVVTNTAGAVLGYLAVVLLSRRTAARRERADPVTGTDRRPARRP